MTRFRYGAATSTGRVRRVNEDSYWAMPPLFAVADGMGGHSRGDIASDLAIETLAACTRTGPLTSGVVLAAIDDANQVILGHAGASGMGTTVTGLAALETAGGDHLMVFNVGDSRVYRLAEGRLTQITVDHSEVEQLVQADVITREEARTHPRRNIVTRALGSDPAPRPDHWLIPAIAGDRYLLCSDGLSSELTDEEILRLLGSGGPQDAAAALVAAAEAAGGHDNITVIVVDVGSDLAYGAGAAGPRGEIPRKSRRLCKRFAFMGVSVPARRLRPAGSLHPNTSWTARTNAGHLPVPVNGRAAVARVISSVRFSGCGEFMIASLR